MRRKVINDVNWGLNVEIHGEEIAHRSVAATWVGGKQETIHVYCWSRKYNLTEFVGSKNGLGVYTWELRVIPEPFPHVKELTSNSNRKISVINTEKGVYLLFMERDGAICWRHRDLAGKWGFQQCKYQ